MLQYAHFEFSWDSPEGLADKVYNVSLDKMDKEPEIVQDLFRLMAGNKKEGTVADCRVEGPYWDKRTLCIASGAEEYLVSVHHAVDENYRDEFRLSIETCLEEENSKTFLKALDALRRENKMYMETLLTQEYALKKFENERTILFAGKTREDMPLEKFVIPLKEKAQDKADKSMNVGQNENTKVFHFKRSPVLTDKQNKLAYAIEKWAFDNNVRNNKGYLLSYNRNAEKVLASFRLLIKQAQERGFKMRNTFEKGR